MAPASPEKACFPNASERKWRKDLPSPAGGGGGGGGGGGSAVVHFLDLCSPGLLKNAAPLPSTSSILLHHHHRRRRVSPPPPPLPLTVQGEEEDNRDDPPASPSSSLETTPEDEREYEEGRRRRRQQQEVKWVGGGGGGGGGGGPPSPANASPPANHHYHHQSPSLPPEEIQQSVSPPLAPFTSPSQRDDELELIDSDAAFCMPELGAEVVVVTDDDHDKEEEEEEGAEGALRKKGGGVRVQYSRRCSYEEMVHKEEDEEEAEAEMEEVDVEARRDCDSILSEVGADQRIPTLEGCLAVLTRWALNLQEVYEDRQSSGMNSQQNTKCRCSTANSLISNLKEVEGRCYEAIDLQDRAALESELQPLQATSLMGLAREMRAMQRRLRSTISILLSPDRLFDVGSRGGGNCGDDGDGDAASRLVGDVCDVRAYVRDATDSLVQLVCDLMGVGGCARHKEVRGVDIQVVPMEEEPKAVLEDEISQKVASMHTSEEEEKEEEEELEALFLEEEEVGQDDKDKENQHNRKRKSSKKSDSTPSPASPSSLSSSSSPAGPPTSTSPTSSPSKRPRRGRTMSAPVSKVETDVCLKLLETKRKGVRQNGLRQFVLWREALRAEKDRNLVACVEEQEELMEEEAEEEEGEDQEQQKCAEGQEGRRRLSCQ